MKTCLICNLLVIIIILIRLSILDNKVQKLEYKNANYREMNKIIINYADSTADTGEFDEFIASPQGERFFDNYHKLYDK